jgi:hypothetical protein
MQKTLDTTWEFEDFNSKCRLRVYEKPDELSVAIVTELAGNPGTTITRAAGYLTAMIYEQINHPLQNLIWIEHHHAGEGRHEGEESFDRVTFANMPPLFDHPERRPMTRSAVEELVGQSLA